MSNPRELAAELRPDLELPWSKKPMMVPIFNVLAPVAFRPYVVFENGRASEDAWQEQVESDAPTMTIMSHAEDADAVLMAPISQGSNGALRQMRYETLVLAKDSLRNMPHAFGLAGLIVRNGGTATVERLFENPNETPEEKELRQKRNMHSREIAVTAMRAGGNVVVYTEGGTGRRERQEDGTFKKIPRKPDEMLPAQKGFADMINDLPQDVRENLRIMTIVSRYSPRRLRVFRPTSVILDPVKPVEGDVEAVRQQGESLMARGFELVKEIDELR